MSQLLACELDETRELDARGSEEVLSAAVDVAAPVRLLVTLNQIERAVSGELIAQDRNALIVKLIDPAETPHWLVPSTVVRATLTAQEKPYVFESTCLRTSSFDDASCVYLLKPRKLAAIERRRNGRKSLHDATEITICRVDGSTHFSCQAAMLNLSPNGLACRVSTVDSDKLRQGARVRVKFRVGFDSPDFDLACKVTNETRGGTPDTVVLGMAFVDGRDQPQSHARIQVALKNAE